MWADELSSTDNLHHSHISKPFPSLQFLILWKISAFTLDLFSTHIPTLETPALQGT